MSKYLALLSVLFIMVACSAPTYKAASSERGYGYREKALSDDQWLVSFRMAGGSAQDAYQLVLKRSAELTLQQGYDWFEVIHRRRVEQEGADTARVSTQVAASSQTVTRCGLLNCETYSRPSNMNTTGLNATTRSQRPYALAEVEIRMGTGLSPDLDNVYLAHELRMVSEAE